MRELTSEEIKKYDFAMLKFVKKFCDDNKIEYFLDFGTLLGAVRHQGFIPWDEDVDLGMLRSNYEKFVNTFNDPSGRYQLFLFNKTDNYYNTFAKIVDTKTIAKEDVKHLPDNYGLWVDIFPYDYWKISDKRGYKKLRFQNAYYMVSMFDIDSKLTLKNIVKHLFKFAFFWKNIKTETKRYIELGQKYKENSNLPNLICSGAVVGPEAIVEAKWYKETVELEFCGELFKCPKMYNEVLTHLYGNTYMQLPKEEDRYNHNIKAWTKE